jgi:hypothetical protein
LGKKIVLGLTLPTKMSEYFFFEIPAKFFCFHNFQEKIHQPNPAQWSTNNFQIEFFDTSSKPGLGPINKNSQI